MSKPSSLHVFTAADIPHEAAMLLATRVTGVVKRRGHANIAISGGSTPKALFRLLSEPYWQERIPWSEIDVWWVDERCVPPDHHESNYAAAFQLLFRHLPVTRLHRMRGEIDPEDAAAAYAKDIRQSFHLTGNARPCFDLILLGMGDDGHTASLFPGTAALSETRTLVTVGHAPVEPHLRITLTLPVLNRASAILFLVSGVSKGPALAQVFEPDTSQPFLPAARVRPRNGRLFWYVDRLAVQAAGLQLA